MLPKAEHFTEKAWGSIISAQTHAKQKNHQNIETEHLLLSLLEQDDLAVRILERSGASKKDSV